MGHHAGACIAGVALALASSSSVDAQTVGIGTSKAGAVFQIATSIAAVASKHGQINMRTQAMAGTQQYIPPVNAGQLEFGVSNVMQLTWAVKGDSLSKGRPNPNLRLVATLMEFRTGAVVAADSGIKSVSDLKGKRAPSGYSGSPLFHEFMEATIANGGLTWNDVTRVPVTTLQQAWDTLAERKIDVATGALGTGYLDLLAQKLGGVRFIQFDDSPPRVSALQAIMPGVQIKMTEAKQGKLTGLDQPTRMMAYDMLLFAGKGVPDDVVYRVAKALYEHPEDLIASSPLWRDLKPEQLAESQEGIEFHPGAQKLFKEKGAWKS
jgi:TRAP transporter TAXI family solute receptor